MVIVEQHLAWKAFLLLIPPINKQVGGAQKLGGDTADQRDIPHHLSSRSVTELRRRGWQGGCCSGMSGHSLVGVEQRDFICITCPSRIYFSLSMVWVSFSLFLRILKILLMISF